MALFLKKLKLEQIQGYPCNVVTLPHWHSICFLEREREREKGLELGLRARACESLPAHRIQAASSQRGVNTLFLCFPSSPRVWGSIHLGVDPGYGSPP